MRRLVVCFVVSVVVALLCAGVAGARPGNPLEQVAVTGRVVDSTGGAVANAQVTLVPLLPGMPITSATNREGIFTTVAAPGTYLVRVHAAGFVEATRRVTFAHNASTTDFTLELAPVQEEVSVGATAGYAVPAVSSATRTPTPLRDIPQAVSVISSTLMADQRVTSMADAVRYMPGVSIAQGEGNRDTPILRGNSSTSDFFVDGVRDDAQYFRDVYNVDRIEALKGPNAMIFGRGGVGGVINRVTRHADWRQPREVALQVGSWGNRRLTTDLGTGITERVAVRATALHEVSDSYRNGVGLERSGFNPTLAIRINAATTLRVGYEYFHDERTADRGISSVDGRPVDTDASTFFGDPERSRSRATVNLFSTMVEHRFGPRVTLRSRLSYGDYDKFYQNVFPGAVHASAATVAISAYNNATTRRNLFNQTDMIATMQTGRLSHTMLVGLEFGRQVTGNFRETGFFETIGANVTSFNAPISTPTVSLPLAFRQSATDADNDGTATVAAVYAQDQVALSSRLDAVVGVRYDAFKADITNNRTGVDLASEDGLISPRLGVVYRPATPVSVYSSYSLTYLPRAGEQLSSLSLTNRALEPEQFRNYEVGTKWDVTDGLALTAAVYRLDRGNVAVTDPNDPTSTILVDAQRTLGLELEWNGRIRSGWSIAGGYAYQDGEITRSISSAAQAGARLAQVPTHAVSLWSKHDLTSRLAMAAGVVHRTRVFTSTDNLVTLPRWTRLDVGVFYGLTSRVRAQVNIENLLNERYYLNAHSNTNITPGSPRALRLTITTTF